jgi:hypothetical protein
MDILDVHIVRIKDHEEETVLSMSDLWLPVDADSYLPVPKKISIVGLIGYIIEVFLRDGIYSVKGIRLVADTPVHITFPTERTGDYVIIPSFVHSEEMTGLTITNETSAGFDIASNGSDTTIDLIAVTITTLT